MAKEGKQEKKRKPAATATSTQAKKQVKQEKKPKPTAAAVAASSASTSSASTSTQAKKQVKQELKSEPAAAAAASSTQAPRSAASSSTQAKKQVKQELKPEPAAAIAAAQSARPPGWGTMQVSKNRRLRPPPKHHREYLEMAVESAKSARAKGNHPFGCVLVDSENDHAIIEAGNSVVTTDDATSHAEMNVVRMACQSYTKEFLRQCTLYASAEPCAMCAGAIYWSGIPRVVYALSERGLKKLARGPTLDLPCRDVFNKGKLEIDVKGPYEVEGMREVHKGFWTQKEGHVNGPSEGREWCESEEEEMEEWVYEL